MKPPDLNILIQFPSRGRPFQFAEAMKSIFSLAIDHSRLIVQVVLDGDDSCLDDYEWKILEYPRAIKNIGTSESKIDAINRPLPDVPWHVLITFSDDMRFQAYGWDQLVRDVFKDGDLDKFVHFYEKDSADRVAVMDVVGKDYYKRDGWIYNPVYLSLFCDEEKTEVARLREKYVYVQIPLFAHFNAAVNGNGYKDSMLEEQQRIGWSVDFETFKERKKAGFSI